MVSKYLENEPDYYIKWGTNSNELTDIKWYVDWILGNERPIEKLCMKHGFPYFSFSGSDAYVSLYEKENISSPFKSMVVMESQIKRKNSWIWKKMYLLVARHLKKEGYVLYSSSQSSISDDAKYLWNSFMDNWIAKYDSVECRFYINNDKI